MNGGNKTIKLLSTILSLTTFLTVSKYRKMAGKGIQTEAEIMAKIDRYLPDQRKHMISFLNHLLPHAGTDMTREIDHL